MGTGRHYRAGFCLTRTALGMETGVSRYQQSSERRKGPRSAGQRRGNESGEEHRWAGVLSVLGALGALSPDPERVARSMGAAWRHPSHLPGGMGEAG